MSFNWTNIKSWTNIGGLGKELKSITLANGKVFEIADTVSSIITIKDTEYSSAPIGALGLHLVGLASSSTFKSAIALAKADPETKSPTIIIEMKIPATIMTPDGTYSIGDGPATNEELNDNWLWFDMGSSWDSTHNIKLTAGHKYQFEQGKMPIDLGPYVSSAPKTIKATEYNDIYQTRYIDNGKDVSSLQFNYLTGDSAKVFDTLHASTDPSSPTEISGKLIIETGINVLSFTNVDYIRFSYNDTASNTFKYLKYTPPKQITFEMRGGRKYQFETNVLPVDLSTEEFKNEIDALPWAQLSHTSYAVVNDEIGYSSIIGAPSLPQGATARVQNGSVSSSGVVNVPILFSKGNITYMKTVSIDFEIKIISTEINSLNWHNLTYINDGSINQNSIIYNDIAGKPHLPQDIEVTNITSDQIIASGIYDVNITFRYTTYHLSTYTKTVSIAFTINPPKAQIIKATDYTSIAYAGGGITITGGTPTAAWSSVSSSSYVQLSKSIAIEVKNDVDCTTRMPYFDWGGTGFTYNAGGNFTLQAGHKYVFENGSLPTDTGTY